MCHVFILTHSSLVSYRVQPKVTHLVLVPSWELLLKAASLRRRLDKRVRWSLLPIAPCALARPDSDPAARCQRRLTMRIQQKTTPASMDALLHFNFGAPRPSPEP